MNDFTFSNYIKLDMSELEKLQEVPDEDDLPQMVIKRSITISDIMRYFRENSLEPSFENVNHITDLKTTMIIRDAKLFASLGYKQVFIRDLAPGSIQISYLLSSEDFTPNYINQVLGE